MKKLTLIVILAVLISLAAVTPVLAGGGKGSDRPCHMYADWHPYMLGFWKRNHHADGAGNPYGPTVWGIYQACNATPPKAYWK